ncbi:MAG: hypothetical protein AVDCRST_MAG19-2826, partial [uncultured Thermomicrobiales bacterium]
YRTGAFDAAGRRRRPVCARPSARRDRGGPGRSGRPGPV